MIRDYKLLVSTASSHTELIPGYHKYVSMHTHVMYKDMSLAMTKRLTLGEQLNVCNIPVNISREVIPTINVASVTLITNVSDVLHFVSFICGHCSLQLLVTSMFF
jgi:hypothetical protein